MWNEYIPWEYVIPFLASLLGFAIRHLIGERNWTLVRNMAVKILKDDKQTDDPKEALHQAMIAVNKPRIEKEVKVLNGIGKVKSD